MIQSTLLAAIDAAFQAAVRAEVDAQLTEIRQHFANTVGELSAKVAALEAKLVEAQLFQRTTHIDINAATDALNQQDWFWTKIRSFIDAGVESATDGLVAEDDLPDFGDFVQKGDLPDFGDFVQKGDLPDFDDFLTKDDFPDADDIVTKDELPDFPDPDDLVTKDELADLVTENLEGRSFTIRF